MSKELTIDNLGPRTRQVVEYFLDNPTLTYEQIGGAMGIGRKRVAQIIKNPKVAKLYPIFARHQMQSRALPKAMKKYEDLINAESEIVAEKASSKVLSTFGLLGDSSTVNVNVTGDITLKSVHDLQNIVKKAAQHTENAIDAELIDEEPA